MADTALVTADQALAHLRADPGEDISIYLGAATLAAIEFLNRNVYGSAEEMASDVLDGAAGDDPMVVNDAIRAAILLTLGHLYRNREDVVAGPTAAALELPLGARTLLQPYRVGLGV